DDAPVTRKITTLVVDIAGFTPLTEHLRARGVAQFLGDYFKMVTDLVFEHQGFVDKFIGDGVLVHFGVPVPAPHDMQVQRAIACARALHRRVRELDEDAGRRPGTTRLRVGIHQGSASVGYFGTAQRSEYTAVGPSVNLAFRIQAVCRPGSTFVSGEVAEGLGNEAKPAGAFDLKGIGKAQALFQIVDDTALAEPSAGRPQVLTAGETFGPYRVLRLVGRGGIAIVYEVRHEKLDRSNALKVLFDKKPEMVARMGEEGRIQGRLKSPHLVPVIDVVEVHGMDALVMPLVEGCSLDDLLARFEPSEDEAVAITLAVAKGLTVAHQEAIAHRDLKPANVLLDTATGVVVPRISDFGLARGPGRGGLQTIPGMFVGTPIYAAPEQYQDATRVGPAADVWGLGALLYELLTGRCPFVNGPFSIIREQVVGARYDERRLPKHWRALVRSMLTVDPEARPPATEVVDALAERMPERDPLRDPRLVSAVRSDEPTEVF
ncbi:MAG: protein kinase, partial [Myxococcota bacterium]